MLTYAFSSISRVVIDAAHMSVLSLVSWETSRGKQKETKNV